MLCVPKYNNIKMDFDNTRYIDLWNIHNPIKNKKKTKKYYGEELEAMKKIRRTHICCKCLKYPGDEEYRFGIMRDKIYTCFDCLM
jgi:hypothetical protein